MGLRDTGAGQEGPHLVTVFHVCEPGRRYRQTPPSSGLCVPIVSWKGVPFDDSMSPAAMFRGLLSSQDRNEDRRRTGTLSVIMRVCRLPNEKKVIVAAGQAHT